MKGFVRNRGGVKQPNGSYKGGAWTAYWEEEKSGDGRRHQGSKSGFPTKKAALDYLAEVVASKQAGTFVAPTRLTFGAYLSESWLPMQKARLRASSYDDYRRRIEKHITPRLGGVLLQDLDAAKLDRFYADLLARGGPSGRPLAPKTVRNVHVVIRKALSDATRKRLVSRNVAVDADPPTVPGPADRDLQTWSPEELRKFLRGVRDHRFAPAFVLAASTGMRRGEVLGLRWKDVDLEHGTIAVRQTIINVAYEVMVSEPKTARGRRTISIDPATVAVLRAHRDASTSSASDLVQGDALVFSRPNGDPIHPDLFTQVFDRAVKRLKLRRVRLHDLRHTYATLALRAGVDAKTVSSRLGHSTVAFTLDVYTKAVPQLDKDAANKVAGLIFDDEA